MKSPRRSNTTLSWTDTKREDIIWCAGLFEGEGTIVTSSPKNKRIYPRIRVKMTDKDSVDKFSATFGLRTIADTKFKNWNPKFWYKDESWKYAKRIGGYPLDAWHLSKSLWWSSMVGGAIVYYFAGPIFPHWILDFATLGLVPMLTFNLFYNHIFKKP